MNTIYITLRLESLSDQLLLQITILVLLGVLLVGFRTEEKQTSALSAALPMMSAFGSLLILRLDFFIHRLGSYLSILEVDMLKETGVPAWEQWKGHLLGTRLLIPATDALECVIVVIMTAYFAFGPSRRYFDSRSWKHGTTYASFTTVLTVAALLSLAFIPIFVR